VNYKKCTANNSSILFTETALTVNFFRVYKVMEKIPPADMILLSHYLFLRVFQQQLAAAAAAAAVAWERAHCEWKI